jgi:yecA family protein
METAVDYDQLDDALRRCGASWDASQAHGLLAGRLATTGADAGFEWLVQVLEGTDANDALRSECEGLLRSLFETTYRQLAERQSEFEPLLPDDEDATSVRAAAMAHWCEGFLHGLVSASHGDALKERLAAEPLSDIIRDMLEITRAAADEDGDGEADEAAYTELVEYLRVAAQLTYEELAEFRKPADGAHEDEDTPEVLH